MKIEVDLEALKYAGQVLVTKPEEATWAIGRILEIIHPEFRELRQQLIDGIGRPNKLTVNGQVLKESYR